MRFLFIPFDMMGHINAGVGLAMSLVERGHTVHYVVDSARQGFVAGYGFEVHPIQYNNPYDFESMMYKKFSSVFKNQHFKYWTETVGSRQVDSLFLDYFNMIIYKNEQVKKLIDRVDPDMLVVDELYVYPALVYSGKPWIFFHSPNPLFFYQDYNLPFPTLGRGRSQNSMINQSLWIVFNFLLKLVNKLIMVRCGYFKWIREPEDWLLPVSPWLNLYCIPEEWDYPNKSMKHWKKSFRLDHLMHPNMIKVELPESLDKFIKDHADKRLIYISLGTIACDDLDIMKKLVDILAKSEYYCIVSKGPRHREYELGDNMWGDRYVPQKSVLQKVDLFITHGGHNSVTEAFSLGVPMIVLPVWMDSVDNAQRIHELGYGVRLDPVFFTEQQLFSAIHSLLTDVEIRFGLKLASKRILKQNRLSMAAKLIERIATDLC